MEAKSNKVCQFLSRDKNIKSFRFQSRGPFSFLTASVGCGRLERIKKCFSLAYLWQANQSISYKGRDKSLSHYVEESGALMLHSALTRAHNEVST